MSKPVKRGASWRIRYLDSFGVRKSETYKTLDAASAALRGHEEAQDEIRASRASLAERAIALAEDIRRTSTDRAELELADDLLVFAGRDPGCYLPSAGDADVLGVFP